MHHLLPVFVANHIGYSLVRVKEPEDLSEPEYTVLAIHLRLGLHLEEGHGAEGLVLLVLCLQ